MTQCHNCGDDAATQTIRHLTDVEYAALPENFLPIDGYAVATVFGCDDCVDEAGDRFATFCEHAEAAPIACPKCNAADAAPCTKNDGSPRVAHHRVRGDAQPAPEACWHAHRADCAVFTDCTCSGDDQVPVRPRRRTQGAGPGPDITGLTIPVDVAQAALAAGGYPWPSVVTVRSLLTQDNRPAVGAEVYTFDADGNLVRDMHGHPVIGNVTVPLSAVPKQLS